jgi:hypothetical protein
MSMPSLRTIEPKPPRLLALLFACATACSPDGDGAMPASQKATALASAKVPPTLAARLAEAPFPPLLFADPRLLALAEPTTGPRFVAFSVRDGDLTLYLAGTDRLHPPPDDVRDPGWTHRVRGLPALLLVNEGVRSLTWEEAGVSWALEAECFHHDRDPRCTRDEFLLSLAEGLTRWAP